MSHLLGFLLGGAIGLILFVVLQIIGFYRSKRKIQDSYNNIVCAYHESSHAVVAKHFNIDVIEMNLKHIVTRGSIIKKGDAHVYLAGIIGQHLIMAKFGLNLDDKSNEEFSIASGASDLAALNKMKLSPSEKLKIYDETLEILLSKWSRVEEVANILISSKSLNKNNMITLGFVQDI